MSALDLSTYILASFSTVEEVRQALDPAHFSVVNFQLSAAAMAILTSTGLLAPGGYPLMHLGIHDAAHNSLVIEFTGLALPVHAQNCSFACDGPTQRVCAQDDKKLVLLTWLMVAACR